MRDKVFSPPHRLVQYVRQQLGTSEGDIERAVAALRDWLRVQPHLPDALEDDLLEHMYINNKCNMGRTRTALDAYFSLKMVYPELLMNRDPLASDIRRSTEVMSFFSITHLTHDGYRVTVVTLQPESKEIDVLAVCKHTLIASETMLAIDYALGNVVIVDLKHLAMGHILAFANSIVRKTILVYQTVYHPRIRDIHVLNPPSLVEKLITIVKSIIPAKIMERVIIHHPGKATLFEYLPREFVPNELGGTAGDSKSIMG